MNHHEEEKNPIDPITMDGSDPALLGLMGAIQREFDDGARLLESQLLETITCNCPRCWDLYWSRLDELRLRDCRIQDEIDDKAAESLVAQHAP